ncbi:brain-specific angiogenesis inhibitor 1-associated protein 2-like protein 2 [Xyrichtys novacula]|nr:brain-specific angiogenesis inhibitor 1-associated protein 2-like protein 2 [Xyrichtys novacula]
MELEGVFRWFSVEVLQEMDNNIRQDIDFISGSQKHYEMEVHNLERQSRRGTNHDYGEYVHFLRESYRVALLEEERRHRYLAEKHCGLLQSVAQLMNKMGGTLQRTADNWADEVNATREPEARRPTYDYGSDYSSMDKREEFRQSREEQSLGRMPSRAPSPQGGVSRSRAESMGSVGGGEGGRTMRAIADHHPVGSSPNVLSFSRGEMITVLVQQPKNGWLYGRAESSSRARKGWFPASFVEAVDDFPRSSGSFVSSSSSSMNSQIYQPRSSSSSSSSRSAAPPPPPPPPSSSSHQQRETQPLQQTRKKKAQSHSDKKGSEPQRSRPELFPRGTNPFATVKLKPTHTDDRSAPRLRR